MVGAADHHSHILPEVDDGVETMDEALRILATYEELGIKELWLTPHIMEDIPNTPEKLKARFAQLQAAYKGNIALHLAAEYMIDNHLRKLLQDCKSEPQDAKNSPSLEKREYPKGEGDKITEPQGEISHYQLRPASEGVVQPEAFQEAPPHFRGEVVEDRRGDKITEPQGEISLINNCPSCVRGASNAVAEGDPPLLPIGNNGKHLLVETSYFNPPIKFRETLKQIKSLGYHPLLAHPERYLYMDEAEYRRLREEGVKFQLNLASLAGGYGKTVKKKAQWLLENGFYSVAGSDLHCEDAIEYITRCKLGEKGIDKINKLLTSSIQ